jgi:outer membrane receptor protein involved in Fe transport
MRVPYLYHLGLGPSVVHPAMVERVDLYPGAYPARYGRFAGGIVAAETAPPEPEFHGEAQLRLIDSGVMLEAPFAQRRGAALVGGRYSYTALVVSLVAPEVELSYWDYQGRVSYELGARDRVELFSFGAYDFLGEEQKNGQTEIAFATEFHRLDLRHVHEPSSRTRIRTALTLGMDRTRATDELKVVDRMLGVRNEIEHRAAKTVLWRGGADAVADVYEVVPPAQQPGDAPSEDRLAFMRLFPMRTDLASGVWTDVVLEPEPGVVVTPGLRLDYYSSEHSTAVGVDPRISASFAVTPKLRLLHALGLAHQPPSFVIPIPGFQVGGLRGGLQRAVQASSGFELDLPEDLTLSLIAFDNVFLNMADPLGTLRNSANESDWELVERRALGSTLGVELMLRRPLTRKLGGFLSYTLSRSTRMFGREQAVATFDRTHVLNLVLGYDLGKNWRAGSRFVFYTGFPRTQGFFRPADDDERPRTPAFWRIDLRLEKRWLLGGRKWWAFVFEIMNATLNREVVQLGCDDFSCDEETIGPVTIPSIGVEAAF